jgi:hypothetical protein
VDPSVESGRGVLPLVVGPSRADGLQQRDQIVLHILSQNAFRRPVYLGPASGSELGNMQLTAALRNEGLASRLLPAREAGGPLDRELLRQNLVHRYLYEAFAQPATVFDRETVGLVSYVRSSFLLLAESDIAAGDTTQAAVTLRQMGHRIPEAQVPLQALVEDLRVARIEWSTGDRAGLARRMRGVLRKYTLSPDETMTIASLLWAPLGDRAAADSLAKAVLLRKPAIDAEAVLRNRQQLLGSAAGSDSVSAWLHGKLRDGGGRG